MNKNRRNLLTSTLALSVARGSAAQSAWPDRPIRMVIPYPPGTGTDVVARYTARRLEEKLGKPVVPDNKSGGSGIVAAQSVIASPADGYTLFFVANAPVTTNVALFKSLPYDPVADLQPIARLAFGPMVLSVPAASPYRSVAELFQAAAKQPGKITYGSGSATYNIASEWLLSLAGVTATMVAYKGAAPALADLAGNQVDFVIADYGGSLPLMASGKIRALAATTDKRLPSEPNLPTLQELGYKEFFQVAWWAVFAPANLPRPIAEKLEHTLLDIYSDDETRRMLEKSHYSAFTAGSQALRKFQIDEIARESRLVLAAKIERQ